MGETQILIYRNGEDCLLWEESKFWVIPSSPHPLQKLWFCSPGESPLPINLCSPVTTLQGILPYSLSLHLHNEVGIGEDTALYLLLSADSDLDVQCVIGVEQSQLFAGQTCENSLATKFLPNLLDFQSVCTGQFHM